MSKKTKEIIAIIVLICLIFTSCGYLAYLLMPTRTSYGAQWNMFLKEPKDSIDVLIVGSSLAYCNIVPEIINNQIGSNSYILGAPEMTMPIMYYYIKEALNTQLPKTIMIEATSLLFEKYLGYSKVSIGYMPWGLNRLAATFNAAEKKERFGLLFPLYNYHDLWPDFDAKAIFKGRSDAKIDNQRGYTYLDTAIAQSERKERKYSISDDTFQMNLEYFAMIREICENNNIELELFITPQCEYVGIDWIAKIRDGIGNIKLIDYNEKFDELGLNLKTDFYDFLHLNYYGAEKFSKIFSNELK